MRFISKRSCKPSQAPAEEEWAERAAAFLKHKLKDTETAYAELVKKLRKHGLKETEAPIANRLARGPFAQHSFSRVLPR
jgi:hypothetical protein